MSESDIEKPKILSQNLFPVVGIGASAGGLEAFKKLISNISGDSGMAYILVQHLHPEYDSALPEILQRITKIPVVEISDNVKVIPDHIYVIPSNKMLVATDGILQLSPRLTSERLNLPIDIFFSSLAEVHQSHSIGIVLSGNGADGTLGLKDIKDNGGLTFAQNIESAGYTGMPQNAINANVVDFILPPERIPSKLLELQNCLNQTINEDENKTKDKLNEDGFRQILALIKTKNGADFNFYKQTTIRRRIIRRLLILHLESVIEYFHYLNKNKKELDILFYDLLISVTSFFRDSTSFEILFENIFPLIFKNKTTINPLRVWVAGCSTGQEAYSIAILSYEYFLKNKIQNGKVQIFATDLSDKSIKIARTGIYSNKELDGVSDFRLQEYFDKTDGHYQVKKEIRDMCIFATHNFIKDPPFAKMDLITCRNALIYLEPFLQKKALTIFHYALIEKGYLWLGKSESTGSAPELFTQFGKKDKFYTRKSLSSNFSHIASEKNESPTNDKKDSAKIKEGKTEDFQKNADDILLAKYTPVGVIVNEQYDIVQFRGLTGKYLEPSPGKASLNVLKMAKDGLAFEIRNALHKVKTNGEPYKKEDITIDNGKKWITIEVIPLLNTIDLHFLILFNDQNIIDKIQNKKTKNDSPKNKLITNEKEVRILQLENELAQAREDMRSLTEDQEASNEELQSSNEELLSGSEELQSLNEELETSKEELLSTNEELITVNQELYIKNDEINQTRLFSEATISILHEPLLVLGKNYKIKSANKSFYKTFKLSESETIGTILFDLNDNGWNIPELKKELLKIQKGKEKMKEIEVNFLFPVIGNRTICFNIQPINRENGEQLILLAIEDITLRKTEEFKLAKTAKGIFQQNQLLNNYFTEAPAFFVILQGPDHIFEFANTMYKKLIGNREILGKKMMDALPELMGQEFVEIVDKVYQTSIGFTGSEIPTKIEQKKGKLEQIYINLHLQAIKNDSGDVSGVLLFGYDVTELVSSRKLLEQNAEMIQNLYINAPAFICTLKGPTYIYELVNPSYQKIFGDRELIGKPMLKALPELAGQGFEKILNNVYETGETYVGVETPATLVRGKDLEPELCYFNFSYQPIFTIDKKIDGILIFGYEVTEEIKGKKIQEESANQFRIMADAMPQKMWTADKDGNVNYLNRLWFDYTKKEFNELKNRGWEKIIHPDDWSQNKNVWLRSIKTGEDFELEHRFLRFDGEYRWHLSRGIVQKDEQGKVTACIGTHTDINDQKVALEKVKIAEEFSRNVLQGSPDCVKVLDKEGRILFMNLNGLCLLEIDDFSLIEDKFWWDLWGDDNKTLIKNSVKKALKGEKVEFQAYFETMKGNPSWWDVIVSPVLGADGKVSQLIAVSRNITEKKIADQQLVKFSEGLELNVKERTNDLKVLNSELEYSNKELNQANSQLQQFAYVASHDLQEPLRKILTFTNRLSDKYNDELNPDAKSLIKKINEASGRMRILIQDLLNYSYLLNHEKLFVKTNLNVVLENVLEDFELLIEQKNAIINFKKLPEIEAIPLQMNQLFYNIIGNALKFSIADKSTVINITSNKLTANEIKKYPSLISNLTYYEIIISDNGIGFEDKYNKQIFTIFQRLHNKSSYSGTGIGLALCKKIMENHGGEIFAISEEGSGAEFHVILGETQNN